MTSADIVPFVVADAAAWRAWLNENEHSHDGVWLALAKKGTTSPTTLVYAEALDEALCSGWIDGQKRSHDAAVFLQRFTPRRRRSMWSQRNVSHIARLEAQGRMRPRGQAEVTAAKSDGRWDAAYAGSADMVMPDEFLTALAASAVAQARYEATTAAVRFSFYHRVHSAKKPETRARRIAAIVSELEAQPTQS